jgi:glycosyltransferase involved in cell wall biosynthesis
LENNLITTIIPTYKRPKLLKRAIESALHQTFERIAVHVYDNASNDDTEEVVRRCMEKDPRVNYWRHPENIGMLGNYQFCLSQVKTEYFSFLSDDDVMFPWFYEEVLKGFEQCPEAAFSAGSAIIMSEKGKVVRVPMDLWEREGLFSPPDGLLQMISKYPVPSCVLFHRKVLDTISIDSTNALTWDCDYFLQIAARYPFYISKRPCGIFLHHSSYSNTKGFEHWEDSWKKVMQRVQANLHIDAPIKKNAVERIQADLESMNRPLIFRSLFHRKFREAHELALGFRKSRLLIQITRLCVRFPFLVHALLWVRATKNVIHQKSFRRYKRYSKWLNS